MIKQGIHINAIYQHFKRGDFYKVIDIANHHNGDNFIVIYHRCDKNGIFKSIRVEINGEEEIIVQPFYRSLDEFTEEMIGSFGITKVPRFKFIKEL